MKHRFRREHDALVEITEVLKDLFDELGVKVDIAGYKRRSYYKDVVGLGAHCSFTDGTMVLAPVGKRYSTTQAEYVPTDASRATYVILFKFDEVGNALLKHVQIIDPLRFRWDSFLWHLGLLLRQDIPRPPGV